MANRVMDAADRYIELDQHIDRFKKDPGAEDDPDEFRQRL